MDLDFTLRVLHRQLCTRIANGESADEVLSRMAKDLLRNYPEHAKMILDGQNMAVVESN